MRRRVTHIYTHHTSPLIVMSSNDGPTPKRPFGRKGRGKKAVEVAVTAAATAVAAAAGPEESQFGPPQLENHGAGLAAAVEAPSHEEAPCANSIVACEEFGPTQDPTSSEREGDKGDEDCPIMYRGDEGPHRPRLYERDDGYDDYDDADPNADHGDDDHHSVVDIAELNDAILHTDISLNGEVTPYNPDIHWHPGTYKNNKKDVLHPTDLPDGIPIKQEAKNRHRCLKDNEHKIPMVFEFHESEECGPIGAEGCTEPVDAWDKFHPDSVWKMNIEETNRRAKIERARPEHAKMLDNWIDVDKTEMEKYFLCLEIMGLKHYANHRDYWRQDWFGLPLIQRVMSRRRFEQIKHCHMVNNPTDEENKDDLLSKTRPFLDLTNKVIQSLYHPRKDIGLDESQIKCCHRNARCSYRATTHKPMSDYINAIGCCESKTGYYYSFIVDERRKDQHVSDIVMDLIKTLPDEGEKYCLYCDRYYTRTDLFVAARKHGAHMCGTCRHNWGPHWTWLGKKGINGQGKLDDGEYYWCQSDLPVPLTWFLWRDSKEEGCYGLSTFHDGTSGFVNRRRYEGGLKPAPIMFVDFNDGMGACDQNNSLRHSYSMHQSHHLRWYMSLVYFCLDLLTINSYIWWREANGSKMNQKDYRLSVINAKCARLGISTEVTKYDAMMPSVVKEGRLDGKYHELGMVSHDDRRACKICHTSKCSFYCKTCTEKYNNGNKIFHCVGKDDELNCSHIWHNVEDLSEYNVNVPT